MHAVALCGLHAGDEQAEEDDEGFGEDGDAETCYESYSHTLSACNHSSTGPFNFGRSWMIVRTYYAARR